MRGVIDLRADTEHHSFMKRSPWWLAGWALVLTGVGLLSLPALLIVGGAIILLSLPRVFPRGGQR